MKLRAENSEKESDLLREQLNDLRIQLDEVTSVFHGAFMYVIALYYMIAIIWVLCSCCHHVSGSFELNSVSLAN